MLRPLSLPPSPRPAIGHHDAPLQLRAPAGRRGGWEGEPARGTASQNVSLPWFVLILKALSSPRRQRKGACEGEGDPMAGPGDAQAAAARPPAAGAGRARPDAPRPPSPRLTPPHAAPRRPRSRRPLPKAQARGEGAALSNAGGGGGHGAARPYLGPSGWRGAPAASPRRSCSFCPTAAAATTTTGQRLPPLRPHLAPLHLAAGGRRPEPRGAAGSASGPARSAHAQTPAAPQWACARVRARRHPGPPPGAGWQDQA